MLDSIYVGLTGLTSYAKGLNNISNNVANLNTTGFKSSQLQFYDLFYNYQTTGDGSGNNSSYSQGSGVAAGNSNIVYTQGELRSTGNDQDAAINGNGFFILRQGNQTFYTRDGQFTFDADGYLVSTTSGARIAGLSGADSLKDINISGLRSNQAKQTSIVYLKDSLSSNDTSFDITDMTVYDSLGQTHTLTLHFDKNSSVTPGSWLVTVKENGAAISNGEVRYTSTGSILAGFDTHTFTYAPTAGATPLTIKLDFNGTNNFSSASSSIKVDSQDGYQAGAMTSAKFDETGNLVINYSNGQTANSGRLALGWFNNLQGLEKVGRNLLVNSADQAIIIGGAGDSLFGKISGGNVESSNVDLSQQFSELITTQRGYQASSQIISAANEMLQQLFDIKKR